MATLFSIGQTAKQAAKAVFKERKSKPINSWVDKLVYSEGNIAPPNKQQFDNMRSIAQYMTAARPAQLENAAIMSGGIGTTDVLNQVHDNAGRESPIGNLTGRRDLVAQELSGVPDSFWEHIPTAYLPDANTAIINNNSPGAAIHELGHAVDMQREGMFGTIGRDIRNAIKPQLLMEFDAWRKGRKAYQEGVAADDDADIKAYLDNMRNYQETKYPAFGTYLGGSIGGIGGAVGGVGLGMLAAMALAGNNQEAFRPLAKMLGYTGGLTGGLLGGMGGVYGGASLGRMYAKSNRDEFDKVHSEALNKLRASGGLDGVRLKLQELRAREQEEKAKSEKPKKKKMQKAAADDGVLYPSNLNTVTKPIYEYLTRPKFGPDFNLPLFNGETFRAKLSPDLDSAARTAATSTATTKQYESPQLVEDVARQVTGNNYRNFGDASYRLQYTPMTDVMKKYPGVPPEHIAGMLAQQTAMRSSRHQRISTNPKYHWLDFDTSKNNKPFTQGYFKPWTDPRW